MTNIDEILKTKVKPTGEGGGGGDSSVEDYLKDQSKMKIARARESEIDKIISENEKDAAINRKEKLMITGASSPLDLSVAVSPNAQHALLKTLIDSGTDAKKAADFLKELDEPTLARLMVLSGNPTGGNSLAPLLLAARQPTTQIGELVDAAQKISTMVTPTKREGFVEYADAFATVADIMDARRPKDDGSSSIREEVRAMRESLEAEREARHQSDMHYQETIATLKESQLSTQLQEIRGELESLKGRNLATEVDEAKQMLEKLGMKVGSGGDLDVIREVTDTIVKAPAVEELSKAVGDRIRSGGGFARPQRTPPGSQTIYCEVCASRGVRTPLTVTPEMQAGKADLTCHICGTAFEKSA